MKNKSYHNFFMNLANETKLDIVLALNKKPLSVTEIAQKINGEQSNVSHHLSNLTKCHLLNVKRTGKQKIYSLNKITILPMLKLVEKHASNNCQECSSCPKNYSGGF